MEETTFQRCSDTRGNTAIEHLCDTRGKTANTSDNRKKTLVVLTPKQFFVDFPFDTQSQQLKKVNRKLIRADMESKFGKQSSAILVMPTVFQRDCYEQDGERREANRIMLINKYGEEFVKKGWNIKKILDNKQANKNENKDLNFDKLRLLRQDKYDKFFNEEDERYSTEIKGKYKNTKMLHAVETKSNAKHFWTTQEREELFDRLNNEYMKKSQKLLPMMPINPKKKLKGQKSVLDTGDKSYLRMISTTPVRNTEGKPNYTIIKCELTRSESLNPKLGEGDTTSFTKGNTGSSKNVKVTQLSKATQKMMRKYESEEEWSDNPSTQPLYKPEFMKTKLVWVTPSSTPPNEKYDDRNMVHIISKSEPSNDIDVHLDLQNNSDNVSLLTNNESSSATDEECSSKVKITKYDENNLDENDDDVDDNSPVSVDNETDEDDEETERILIAENYDHIVDFFSAKNLSQHELRLHPDDPLIMNKFYKIASNNGVTDWQLNRTVIMDNLSEFINLPVPIGFLVKCRIFRDRHGVDRGLFPTYIMHLENERCKNTLLMTARKRKKSTTTNYLISIDPMHLVRTGESVVGKLRGNLVGTQFILYDGGHSPSKYEFGRESPRRELVAIYYEPNILGFKGPRKMRFLIPAMISESKRFERHPDGDHDTMLASSKKGLMHGIIELRNKTPLYNTEANSFVLNFKGRVTQASVKNFQIIHSDKEDYTILQFGRVSEDVFSLDIKYPLCPLQAFGIILSSFANKLAVE